MAATVGTLVVDVDINSAKATATFVKAMKVAGEAGGEALESGLEDVDTKKLEAQLRLLRAKIETIFARTGVVLNFDGEFRKLQSDIALQKAEFEANQWGVKLDVFDEKLKLQLAAAERLIDEATREREIEIAAQLEIAGFQAEVKRLESFKYGAEFEAVLETARLEYEAKIVADRERELEFTAELRASLFYAELEAIERDERAVKIAAELEKTEFLAEIARLESFKYGTEFEAILETARFQYEVRQIENTKAEITAELETALAEAQAVKLRKQIQSNRIKIDVDFDVNNLDLQQLRLIRELQEANAINIPVKADTKNFSANILKSLPSDLTKVFLALGLIAGDALISGIAGALSAGTAIISSAAQGLAGAIVPTVAILGGLAGVLGAVVVGSQGVGAAFGAYSEELKKANEEGRDFNRFSDDITQALGRLSPSARDTAVAFGRIREEIQDIRRDVQDKLFKGLANELTALSSSSGKAESAIENFGGFLELAAESANRFIDGLLGIANSTDFAGTFTAIQPAVDAILDTILKLVATFEPFLLAAAPAAEKLAYYLSQSADALNDWTSANIESISEILVDGVTSLETWFGLLGNIGGLLADVFSAGQETGDNFVQSLDNIITRFRVFLTDNDSQRLKDFFAAGEEAISAFKPLVVGLKDALGTLTGEAAAETFRSLSESVGEFLPVFADLLLAIGQLEILQAALNLIVFIGDAISQYADILGDAAPLVGAFIVSFLALSKVIVLVKGLQVALIALEVSVPALLIVTAVLAAALVALQYFTGGVSDATERTEELIPVLERNVQQLINTATAATAASVGVDALTASLLSDSEQGEVLSKTITTLNIDAEDLLDIFAKIGEDNNLDQDSRIRALADLAGEFKITGEAAAQLGAIVDGTDDNFENISFGTNIRKQLQEIADASGLTIEEVQVAAQALEELQDQAENTKLDDLAKEFILLEGGATKVNSALLAQAEENTNLKRTGEDLFPLFEEFTRLLALNEVELKDTAQALIEEGIELENAKFAADQAAEATRLLAEANEQELQAALALTKDALGTLSDELQGSIAALKEGAEKAESFRIRLDALVPTAFGVEGALDGAQKAINELVKSIVDGDDKFVGFEELLTGTSTAAIDQRTALRDTAAEIFAYAEAALEGGVGAGQAALKVDELSDSLAAQLVELGLNEEEIQALLVQYGLTPDQINTVFGSNAVQQKGLIDEYVGAAEGALGIIETTFTADGLDPITGLVARSVEDFVGGLDDLNGRIITTDIETPTIDAVTTGVNDLDIAFDNLPPTTDLFIEIPGLDEDIMGVDTLATAIINLPNSKTIYINTVYSSSGNVGSSGNGSTSGNSDGGDFFSSTAPTNTSNVTNHFNISGTSDAHAVATQVANRSALAVM